VILFLTSPLSGFVALQGAPVATAPAPTGAWDLAAWAAVLACIGLAPFVLAALTSFGKLVIVGGILRRALGTPEIPPNSVIAGLAILLTMHIMSPVATEVHRAYTADSSESEEVTAGQVMQRLTAAGEAPLADFLKRHSNPANVQLFETLRARLMVANGGTEEGGPQDPPAGPTLVWARRFELLTIYAPAFLLTELAEAFMLGFLLFVPFLVIDLAVSNLLLALGMHMVSPTHISLPLKLLLFVVIDGWKLLLQGLVLGYS